MEKIFIDTDCGVDDAMAVLLALSSERSQILGITCCFGNTNLENVHANVQRILNLCRKTDIPVYKGSSGPLLSIKRRPLKTYHAKDGLGNCAHEFPTGGLAEQDLPASMALVQLAKKHPGEITVIALGPLSNLAIAHRIDPLFTQRLKSIVCMGGNYKGVGNSSEVSEFNFYCDPEAADIVLGESLCPVLLVPWETTVEYGLKLSLLYEKLIQVQTQKGHFYKRITNLLPVRAKARGKDTTTDCDLLAVAAALYPESITSSIEYPLAVECGGTYSRGLTILLNEESLKENGNREKVKIITGFNVKFLDDLRFQMLQDKPISV